MRTRWPKFVTLFAIGAIATANCYWGPAAQASHHPDLAAAIQTTDQHMHDGEHADHSHDFSAADHSEDNSASGGKPSSVCCTSMTCMAMGVVTSAGDSAGPARGIPGALALDDAVRTAAIGILDPPPRTI